MVSANSAVLSIDFRIKYVSMAINPVMIKIPRTDICAVVWLSNCLERMYVNGRALIPYPKVNRNEHIADAGSPTNTSAALHP